MERTENHVFQPSWTGNTPGQRDPNGLHVPRLSITRRLLPRTYYVLRYTMEIWLRTEPMDLAILLPRSIASEDTHDSLERSDLYFASRAERMRFLPSPLAWVRFHMQSTCRRMKGGPPLWIDLVRWGPGSGVHRGESL